MSDETGAGVSGLGNVSDETGVGVSGPRWRSILGRAGAYLVP